MNDKKKNLFFRFRARAFQHSHRLNEKCVLTGKSVGVITAIHVSLLES